MKALVLIHRWLGVPMSLLFVLWFLSGIVILFVPFPSLATAERLAGTPALEEGDVRVTPRAAVLTARQSGLTKLTELRLVGR